MSKPRLLDLFCGAGGAAMGYHQAGFEVVGVDIEPRPLFPFEFMQHDALTLDPGFLASFDAIHASPPCQAYTGMQALNTRAPKRDHPKLIVPVRAMLIASGLPYIIENVAGAKKEMIEPYVLCGSMFGLGVRRHRLFETSFFMLQPKCQHDRGGVVAVWGDGRPTRQEVRKARRAIAVYGDHPQDPGNKPNNVNRARTLAEGQEAMGIDWMDWRTLTQAIPPAYTRFIGAQLMAHLEQREAA